LTLLFIIVAHLTRASIFDAGILKFCIGLQNYYEPDHYLQRNYSHIIYNIYLCYLSQINMVISIFDQAILAAQEKKWGLVTQDLQQILLTNPAEDERVLDLALQVLIYGDFTCRWEVAKLFPKLGKKAISPLINIIQDDDADGELRWFTGKILADFPDLKVITVLVDLLETTEDEELIEVITNSLGNMGQVAIDLLTDLLAQEETRFFAVRSLSQIRHSQTITPLLSVVNDADINVRLTAVEALSSFHDDRVFSVLVNSLKDVSAQVRKQGVMALGLRKYLLTNVDLVSIIKPLLYDFNIDVCRQTALSLGRLGTDSAAEALFTALNSVHTPVILKTDIIRALGWIETVTAVKYLQESLSNHSTNRGICQEIITSLSRIENDNLKEMATEILINLTIEDDQLKQTVAVTLGILGKPQAKDYLVKLEQEENPGVKLHAIAALKKLGK
jgi:HEAT repeat protein